MITRVISGGQTGADVGGLLGARDAGVPTGGSAPDGFLTEDGNNPGLKEFGLEDSGQNYPGRTRLNVKNSDVTLWFGAEDYTGYAATVRETRRYNKPFIVCDRLTPQEIYEALKPIHPSVINVAGTRGSKAPGIESRVRSVVHDVLELMKHDTGQQHPINK
jgi:hypothetical protein